MPEDGRCARSSYVREVLNYVNALEYGLKRVETLPVSLRLMRELHERLLAGVRGQYATPGEFRRSQNWIGPPGCTLNEATFVPPPVPQMQEALNDLEKYLHSDDMLRVSERGTWRDWLLFFLRGVTEQAGDALRRARRLQDLREEWHRHLTQARASALLIRLVDALFSTPILTIPQAQRLLDITYRSAQRNVEKLVQAGILQLASETVYGKTYVATEIMSVIGEEHTSE